MKYEHLATLSNLKSCQFEDSLIISTRIIPMSHHIQLTNEGSFFSENLSLSFGT